MKRIIVKSFLQDAKNTGSIPSVRSKMIEEASSKSVASDFRANALAKTLHPEYFPVRLKKAEAVNGFMCAEIVRCDSDEPFYFKGGQYLGIRYSLEGKEFFSAVPTLGLSGEKVLKTAFIREYDENAFSFFEKAQDKEFTAVSFEGHMNFSGIRDKNGGVCLTDIFALPSAVSFGVNAKSIYGGEPVRIYLDCEDDALFEEAVKVASGFEINRFTPDEALFSGDETLFITGEYDFCEGKASFFEKKCRLIKKYPINTVRTFDSEVLHSVRVHCRELVFEAMCKEGEVLSSALLNAGVPSDIRCTDGECGYCTLRLVSGEVRSLLLTGDRRKGADVVYGFIHPCSVTPVSDIILEL